MGRRTNGLTHRSRSTARPSTVTSEATLVKKVGICFPTRGEAASRLAYELRDRLYAEGVPNVWMCPAWVSTWAGSDFSPRCPKQRFESNWAISYGALDGSSRAPYFRPSPYPAGSALSRMKRQSTPSTTWYCPGERSEGLS